MKRAETTRQSADRGAQAGFTLTEVLMAGVLLVIVGSMIMVSYTGMQRALANKVNTDHARTAAREAVENISLHLRNANLPSTYPIPTPSASASHYAVESGSATDCYFYAPVTTDSAAVEADGTGRANLRLARLYIDTCGTKPYKTLYLAFDTNDDKTVNASDGTPRVLARNVVNTTVSPTTIPLFKYVLSDNTSGTTTLTNADAGKLVGIRIRLLIDQNIYRPPRYVAVESRVFPRNQVAQ